MNTMEVSTENITDIKLTPEQIKEHLTKFYRQKELKKARNRRYAQSAKGKKVRAASKKKYYEEHKEQIKERAKQRYTENKEHIAEKRRERRLQKKREQWDKEDEEISDMLDACMGEENWNIAIKEIRKILNKPRE